MKKLVWGVNRRNIEIYNGRGKKLATVAKDDLDIDQQISVAKRFCASSQMYWALCACWVEFEKFGLQKDDPIVFLVNEALDMAENKVLTQRKTPKVKKAA